MDSPHLPNLAFSCLYHSCFECKPSPVPVLSFQEWPAVLSFDESFILIVLFFQKQRLIFLEESFSDARFLCPKVPNRSLALYCGLLFEINSWVEHGRYYKLYMLFYLLLG